MDLKTALHNLVDLLTLHPSSAAQAHDTIDQIEHQEKAPDVPANVATEKAPDVPANVATEKAPDVPANVATNVAMGVPREETDQQS